MNIYFMYVSCPCLNESWAYSIIYLIEHLINQHLKNSIERKLPQTEEDFRETR